MYDDSPTWIRDVLYLVSNSATTSRKDANQKEIQTAAVSRIYLAEFDTLLLALEDP